MTDSYILNKSPTAVPEVPFPQVLHQWAWEGSYKKESSLIIFWISASPFFFLPESSMENWPGYKTFVLKGPKGFYVLWESPRKITFAFLFPSAGFPWKKFVEDFNRSYEGVQSLNKGKNPLAVPAFVKDK